MATAADQDRRLRPDQRNAFLAALLGWTMDAGSDIDKAAVAAGTPTTRRASASRTSPTVPPRRA